MTTRNSRRSEIYAVIRAGGKQYRVERDQLLDVDLMEGDVGSTVELKDVLLIANNGDVSVGTPTVDGAVVEAEIVEHGKGPKLRIFKYKNKTRYRRRMGHRTHYTRLEVKRILQDGKDAVAEEEKPKKRAPSRKSAKAKAAEVATEAKEEVPTEAPSASVPAEVEAKPKRAPRKAPRKKAAAEADVEASAEAPTIEPSTETEEKPKRARRTTRKKADDASAGAEEPKKPARRRTTRAKAPEPTEEEKPDEDKGANE